MPHSILIVDDNVEFTDALTTVLDEEGYRVRAVGDGAAALDAIDHELPDLILSDVMMPGLDGATLLKELRAQGLLMPVVLMSALAAELELPDVAVVAKPFDLDHIVALIAQLLADC